MAKTKKRATEQIRVLPENEIYVGAFSYHSCSQEGVHPVYCLGVFEDCPVPPPSLISWKKAARYGLPH